jgi:2-C-methyl-D-erythritol 4-phosphate cytidylyltransferase
MKTTVIIAAGGSGTRMGAPRPKQLLPLKGIPILMRTLDIFENHPDIDEIIVSAHLDVLRAQTFTHSKIRHSIRGGETRQQSVHAALKAVSPDTQVVLIHDAVRPLVAKDIIAAAIAAARDGHCAVAGIPAWETVKITGRDGFIKSTTPRHRTYIIQTPQCFPYGIIMEAYETAARRRITGTDDSTLVERLGVKVKIIPGDPRNLKITTPEDLRTAETFL